jgi:hypothetical protein
LGFTTLDQKSQTDGGHARGILKLHRNVICLTHSPGVIIQTASPVPPAPLAVKLRVSTSSRGFLLGDYARPPLPAALDCRYGAAFVVKDGAAQKLA